MPVFRVQFPRTPSQKGPSAERLAALGYGRLSSFSFSVCLPFAPFFVTESAVQIPTRASVDAIEHNVLGASLRAASILRSPTKHSLSRGLMKRASSGTRRDFRFRLGSGNGKSEYVFPLQTDRSSYWVGIDVSPLCSLCYARQIMVASARGEIDYGVESVPGMVREMDAAENLIATRCDVHTAICMLRWLCCLFAESNRTPYLSCRYESTLTCIP